MKVVQYNDRHRKEGGTGWDGLPIWSFALCYKGELKTTKANWDGYGYGWDDPWSPAHEHLRMFRLELIY